MDSLSHCVVVTGFGPFRQHLVNSSWEAVKQKSTLCVNITDNIERARTQRLVPQMGVHEIMDSEEKKVQFYTCSISALREELSKLGLGSDAEVELKILQLPVDYREVKQRVTRIWEDLQPQLTVHIGMDASAKAIFLEQCGKNRGYRDADIRGFRPEGGACLPDGPEVITSEVSMKAVCRRVNVEGTEVTFSRDAGRYVCDYTYYLSLHHGNGCAALIHIPALSRRLPASLLGKALQVIIREMLVEREAAQAESLDRRTLSPSASSQEEPHRGLLL